MAISWLPVPPAGTPGTTGAEGDIVVSLLTAAQFRWTAGAWSQIVPPETRGDAVASGGQLNDRLAKTGGNNWELGWRNAAAGVVTDPPQNFTSATVWAVTHGLGQQVVDVTVLSPGLANPTAPQTIIVPEVNFVSDMQCTLTFAEPVAGTVVVRR